MSDEGNANIGQNAIIGQNANVERKRTPPRRKAKELAKYLRAEHPDYNYMKDLFRYLRVELEVEIPKPPKKLPYIPSEDELRRYYEVVWRSKNFQDMVIIKTLLYTGVRVSELVNIKLDDIDFGTCQIRINHGKGGKDRVTPFPQSFREILAMHADTMRKREATYLFESSWKKNYTTRGISRSTPPRYYQPPKPLPEPVSGELKKACISSTPRGPKRLKPAC